MFSGRTYIITCNFLAEINQATLHMKSDNILLSFYRDSVIHNANGVCTSSYTKLISIIKFKFFLPLKINGLNRM